MVTTNAHNDYLAPPNDDPAPECEVCGNWLVWDDCDHCGGDGVRGHDCGEDTCCCLYPEDNVTCDICAGEGGWWYCPDVKSHPESEDAR